MYVRLGRIVPGEWRKRMPSAINSSASENWTTIFTVSYRLGQDVIVLYHSRLRECQSRFRSLRSAGRNKLAPLGQEVVLAFATADVFAEELAGRFAGVAAGGAR